MHLSYDAEYGLFVITFLIKGTVVNNLWNGYIMEQSEVGWNINYSFFLNMTLLGYNKERF